jgi:hypothetical protein
MTTPQEAIAIARSVDCWREPITADMLAKIIDAAIRMALTNPPRHKWWGAGEPDCPKDIKGSNGELHTLRCKLCGTSDTDSFCTKGITP